ncbi:Ig-like domain-containing protein [Patescibacteria group bacterium]
MRIKDLLVSSKNQRKQNKKFVSLTAKTLLLVILILAVFLLAEPVLAVELDVGLEYGAGTGLGTTDIRITVARIIRTALGLLGIIAVSIVVYAGFAYMTSAGNPEKVERAKKILINAFIGLLIILSAFSIASFVITWLLRATGVPPFPGDVVGYGAGGGALGAGPIETHYPPRNAFNIPRNTSIVVTFKPEIQLDTVIDVGDVIDLNSVKIYKTNDPNKELVENVKAYATPDQKTFVFRPQTLLGSAEASMFYTVELTNNIAKALDGSGVFGNYGGYAWSFEVSNIIDITPPQVTNIIPIQDALVPKNTIIRADFNEAINPLTIGGIVVVDSDGKVGNLMPESFDKLHVYIREYAPDNTYFIAGEFSYSNNYTTVEFVSNDKCGENTCGDDVFCLPENEQIFTVLKAASLESNGSFAAFPYDGVVDMADNSLDGDYSGTAEGPSADNYLRDFNTNDVIDLIPPEIISRYPGTGDVGVSPADNFELKFDKVLMSSTIKSDSGYNDGKEYISLVQPAEAVLEAAGYPKGGWGYWLGNSITSSQTLVTLLHAQLGEDLPFGIRAGSGLKDNTQNCYNPCSGPGCVRLETDVLGQYEKGSPWSGPYPTCDLTSSNYESFGDFILSYDDQGVNKLFNFSAFGLSDDIPNTATAFYKYQTNRSYVAEHGGVFAQMLDSNRVVTVLYYSQDENKYYLINWVGGHSGGGGGIGALWSYVKASGYNIILHPSIRDDSSLTGIDCDLTLGLNFDSYKTDCPDNKIVTFNYFGQSTGDGLVVEIGTDATQTATIEFGITDIDLENGPAEWYFYSPQGPIQLEIPGTIQVSF